MQIPSRYLRSHEAPEPRTLIDIVRATASACPEAPAIDEAGKNPEFAQVEALFRERGLYEVAGAAA